MMIMIEPLIQNHRRAPAFALASPPSPLLDAARAAGGPPLKTPSLAPPRGRPVSHSRRNRREAPGGAGKGTLATIAGGSGGGR